MPDERRIALRLSDILYDKLVTCVKSGQTLSDVVREALEVYVSQQPPRQTSPSVSSSIPLDVSNRLVKLEEQVQQILTLLQRPYSSNVGRRPLGTAPSADKPPSNSSPYTPTYKPDIHYLGKLCPHGHDWDGTGQTLRKRSNQSCVICSVEWVREKRRKRREDG